MMIKIKKFRDKLTKMWINNQPKTLFILFLVLILSMLLKLPYFNIFLEMSVTITILYLSILFLFKLKSNVTIFISAISIIISTLLVLIQENELANEVANFAFYLIIISFIQQIFEEKKKL